MARLSGSERWLTGPNSSRPSVSMFQCPSTRSPATSTASGSKEPTTPSALSMAARQESLTEFRPPSHVGSTDRSATSPFMKSGIETKVADGTPDPFAGARPDQATGPAAEAATSPEAPAVWSNDRRVNISRLLFRVPERTWFLGRQVRCSGSAAGSVEEVGFVAV